MMDLDHAKTVVNHLLTATDIKAVYYVDDKFQKDAEIDDHIEKFLIAIEKCYANGQIDDFPEHVRFAGNDNLDAEVRAWWSGMTTEQKQQKFEKYVIGGAENIRPALLVREIMDNQCTCCSPSEWNNNYKAEALDKIGRKESQAKPVERRLAPRYCCNQRLWHGYRQTRCAYCGTHRPAFVARGILSGSRSCRTRR